MAHPRHEEVRARYARVCGYCGVREIESGGELTVDHYRPVAIGGDDSDENLVYACFRCNLYKGDFFPSPQDVKHGRRILHPLRDDLSLHVRENPLTGHVEPGSQAGGFHIQLLRLNRPQLVDLRLQRRLIRLLTESWELLREDNDMLRRRVDLLERYLQQLHLRLRSETENDPPV